MDKISEPILHVTYCDDIRIEVGDKLSVMGIYNSDMLFSQLPTVLPKFCVLANLRLPLDHPTPEWIELRLMDDKRENVIATSGRLPAPDSISSDLKDDLGVPYRCRLINAMLMIAPFSVHEEHAINTCIETSAGTFYGQPIRLRRATGSKSD